MTFDTSDISFSVNRIDKYFLKIPSLCDGSDMVYLHMLAF